MSYISRSTSPTIKYSLHLRKTRKRTSFDHPPVTVSNPRTTDSHRADCWEPNPGGAYCALIHCNSISAASRATRNHLIGNPVLNLAPESPYCSMGIEDQNPIKICKSDKKLSVGAKFYYLSWTTRTIDKDHLPRMWSILIIPEAPWNEATNPWDPLCGTPDRNDWQKCSLLEKRKRCYINCTPCTWKGPNCTRFERSIRLHL